MKFFIKKIALFAFFVISLIIILQAIICIRIKGKAITGYDNLDQTSNINADLVFLGSSRCWANFDPEFFDSTYKLKSVNIGVDGHSEVPMVFVRLKNYLAGNKPPKFAILEFDPFVNTNNSNDVHKDNFARYAFLPETKDTEIVNYFKFNFYEKYIPLYSIFKYNLLTDCIFLNNTDVTFMEYGYERHDEKWDTISKPVTGILKNFFLKNSEVNSITNSLNNLNHLCLANNIKLLCIQTPVYKVCQDDSVFSIPKKICLSVHVPFIDANKAYIRDNIDNFYNSNHLNTKGVVEMNSVLKKDTLLASFLRQ